VNLTRTYQLCAVRAYDNAKPYTIKVYKTPKRCPTCGGTGEETKTKLEMGSTPPAIDSEEPEPREVEPTLISFL
jgi:hypothetical protein